MSGESGRCPSLGPRGSRWPWLSACRALRELKAWVLPVLLHTDPGDWVLAGGEKAPEGGGGRWGLPQLLAATPGLCRGPGDKMAPWAPEVTLGLPWGDGLPSLSA